MNMSLPSGDLSDLLGPIPADMKPGDNRSKRSLPSIRSSHHSSFVDTQIPVDELPALPLDEHHPYHLLVVGSQECPWVPSSFLGDLRGQQNVSWTDIIQDYLCRGGGLVSRPNEQTEAEEQLATPLSESPSAYTTSPLQDPPLGKLSVDPRDHARNAFQPGSPGSPNHTKISKRSSSLSAQSVTSEEGPEEIGPYVLVSKERLIGIYVATFVLKSCERLVQGVSKGKVTAGLLNGRVGNKGATAVSLHFASFRFLFVSAHLAAHQEATAVRSANVNRIKEELDIDDFLLENDKRKQMDLTDRFDYVFWFGDLNYRLDVSRLHADWLLSTKAYSTALAFDQLKAVLNTKDSCFKGFKEGEINFPPTYKYDLVDMPRRRPTRKTLTKTRSVSSQTQTLIIPADLAHPVGSPQSNEGSDTASLSSVNSAAAFDTGGNPKTDLLGDEPPKAVSVISTSPDPSDSKSIPPAVHRARVKFLGMVRSKSNLTLPLPSTGLEVSPDPTSPSFQVYSNQTKDERRSPFRWSKSEVNLAPLLEKREADAIFDTSKKQRVQSYTDRILYKTNVKQEAAAGHPSMGRRFAAGWQDSIKGMGRIRSRLDSTHPASDDTAVAKKVLTRDGSGDSLGPTYTNKPSLAQPPPTSDRGPRLSFTAPRPTRSNSEPLIEPDEIAAAPPPGRYPLQPSQTIADLLRAAKGHDIDDEEEAKPPHRRSFSRRRSVEAPAHHFNWRHFLSNLLSPSTDPDAPVPGVEVDPESLALETRGPRQGEIECLVYNSANDLRKMEALTDHRPVYAVFACGAGRPST